MQAVFYIFGLCVKNLLANKQSFPIIKLPEGNNVKVWLHLHYKVPRNPTSRRVYVWRKLKKRLGAILLHDSVWILPKNPWTLEQFEWLVMEIKEMEGEASLWEASLLLGQKDENLIQQFIAQVNEEYQEILNDLYVEKGDLVSLSKRYQRVKMIDYFDSPVGIKVQEAIKKARRN